MAFYLKLFKSMLVYIYIFISPYSGTEMLHFKQN